MKILCRQCGTVVAVEAPVGRKAFDIGVSFISDVLRKHYEQLREVHSGRVKHQAVCDAAGESGVSPAYVYQQVKQAGLTVDSVLAGGRMIAGLMVRTGQGTGGV